MAWDAVQIVSNLGELSGRVRPAAAAGIVLALEYLGAQSDAVVPLDEGTLKRSRVVQVDDEGLRGVVSYNTPYAVRQHEDLTYSHPGGRQAKFLESAFLSGRAEVGKIVAAEIRGEL